jgi:hypothetical protein
VGTLTSWNPLGHYRPVTGLLYLNFLEPSGPLQACNRTALPLPIKGHFYFMFLEEQFLVTTELLKTVYNAFFYLSHVACYNFWRNSANSNKLLV